MVGVYYIFDVNFRKTKKTGRLLWKTRKTTISRIDPMYPLGWDGRGGVSNKGVA